MARDPCDACGQPVRIAGGIAAIWSLTQEPSGGMALTFEDGTETFLCFSCIGQLPPDPTAADLRDITVSEH